MSTTSAVAGGVRRPWPWSSQRLRRWLLQWPMGLRARLAAFSVLLVLVAAGGSAYAGWQIVEGLLQQEATDRLDVATKTFNSIFQQRVSDAEIVTRQLS